MRELIAPDLVERLFVWVALAGPIFGLLAGAIAGARGVIKARLLGGFLIGLLGPVVYGLWRVYGAITGWLGLDSVWNLFVQMVLFAILGVVLGVVGLKVSTMLRRLEAGG